jgi:D-alanyl-D-alanine carboxypeptidase (penicillin-binding protein 5/6)
VLDFECGSATIYFVSTLFRLFLLLTILLSAAPAMAGYMQDTCAKNKPRNLVRADMVFDLDSGKILIEKNSKKSFHPASLSKLMALAIVYDDLRAGRYRLTDKVQLVKTGGQFDGRTASIKSMTVREAIMGVATASLNNALDGLAAKTSPDKFVARMNEKAKAWGLTNTRFINPTGWPTPQSMNAQRTTLRDYAQIVRKMEINYPKEMKQFSGLSEVEIKGLKKPLKSTNNLLETSDAPRAEPYEGVVAGKTGYTCYSGWHLVAVFEDRSLNNRRLVAMSVGHATGKERDEQVKELLDTARPKLRAYVKEEERLARLKAQEEARQLAEKKEAERQARRAAELKAQANKQNIERKTP